MPARDGQILVTGGLGLLGREVARQLHARGHAVCVADRQPADPADPALDGIERLAGDLLEPSICVRACHNVRVVIHAAAVQYHSGVPRRGRAAFFEQNVAMTRNLVAACAAGSVEHIVMVSSDMTYGVPTAVPIPESATQRPIGPYGRSKLECERLCLAEVGRPGIGSPGFGVTILRPRLIIGPGRLGVLRRLFDRVRSGKPVPVIGSGRTRYQMVAVADAAAACVLAAERRAPGVMNLGSADPPTVNQLLGELVQRAGTGSRLVHLPARLTRAALSALDAMRLSPLAPEQFRIADRDYVLDISRAAAQLGWRPERSDVEMVWAAYQSYVGGPTRADAHVSTHLEAHPRTG